MDIQLHLYIKNKIAKRCLRMLAIIKDILFINSDFPINFLVEAIDALNYLQNRFSIKYSKYILI